VEILTIPFIIPRIEKHGERDKKIKGKEMCTGGEKRMKEGKKEICKTQKFEFEGDASLTS
tara:strand:+ start:3528 stop:3707 length:180 start_codon:yes stop_codon:yes gene_type:complete